MSIHTQQRALTDAEPTPAAKRSAAAKPPNATTAQGQQPVAFGGEKWHLVACHKAFGVPASACQCRDHFVMQPAWNEMEQNGTISFQNGRPSHTTAGTSQ